MTVFKKNKGALLLIIFLAVSIVINLYLLIDKFNNSHSNVELKKNLDLLDKELKDARDEINKYVGLTDGLDKVINKANLSITQKEKKIKDLLALNELKADDNQKLLIEISEMKEQYLNTIDSLLIERKINSKLNNTIVSLESKVTNLNKKLGTAEQLPITNIEVSPQKNNAIGSTNQTALAKKATEIQICYNIQPNKATPLGEKVIFIRIFDPFGHFLNDKNLEKAEFMHPDYNINVPYTLTDTIDFKNESMEICTRWKNPENYISGVYLVELYTEKESIGTTTFTLR
jgi:hypothetical protein